MRPAHRIGDWGGGRHGGLPAGVVDAMAELGDQLRELVLAMSEDDSEAVKIPRVVQFAAAALPGAEHAAISIARHHSSPHTIAATGELPTQVDSIQYDLHEGPCVEALDASDVLWSDDLRARRALAPFRPAGSRQRRGAEHGELPAVHHRRPPGGAEFLLDRGAGLRPARAGRRRAVRVLRRGHAARRPAPRQGENLERALQSSREIGIAMGILMARQPVHRGAGVRPAPPVPARPPTASCGTSRPR